MKQLSYYLQLNSIGADPELFLHDKDGNPVPVIGLLGGTKEDPKPVPELGKGFCIQEDNVMVEFNIPPCSSKADLDASLGRMLSYLTKVFEPMNLRLSVTASEMFRPNQLTHPQAQRAGCDPDYDVWARKQNSPPDPEHFLAGLRSAGGHVHVGYSRNDHEPLTIEDKELVVRALDFYLGIPANIIDPDKRRKLLYGKPGAFRPKPYGIEYRTLSNFWIATPELRQWVYSCVQDAFNFLSYPQHHEFLLSNHAKDTLNALLRTTDLAFVRSYMLSPQARRFRFPVSFLRDYEQLD